MPNRLQGANFAFTLLVIAFVIIFSLTLSSRRAEATSSGAGVLNYPELQPLDGLSDPSLAFGVDGIADWMANMPFLNIAKQGRYWIGNLPGQWGGFWYEDFVAGGYLDRNGYPTRIPPGVTSVDMIFDWEENKFGTERERNGRYIFTYEGEGDIRVQASRIVSREKGRIVFDVTQGGIVILIYSTDPKGTGNNLRNFEIVREDRLPLYRAGAIFNPNFIDSLKDARHLRFMGAMNVNNSLIVSWDEYPTEDHFAWREMPVSVMVKLANEVGSDPWFTMPFRADDNFIRRFAEYVYDHLDPRLIARVELSNEVWNFLFSQSQDALKASLARYGTDKDAAWMQYFGERTANTMSIWSSVYGSDAKTRLRRVLGAFTAIPWYTEMSLTAPHWRRIDPNGYYPPHTVIDEIAITTYFGGESIVDPKSRAALLAAIKNPGVNDLDWHRDQLIPNIRKELTAELIANKQLAERFNKGLVVYEGGQHVHHAAGLEEVPKRDLDALQDHLTAFVRSPQMAELYSISWDEWQKINEGPYMQFSVVGPPNFWGSWSMLASYVDSTPRASYLYDKNKTTPAWWENRGGDHFRHGRRVTGSDGNDTLAGTIAEDFLIGGEGEDLIYAGPGDDGINGGAGHDTAIFRGNRSAYEVRPEGDGYRVIGPDGSDYVHAVETLYFEDSKRISLKTISP